MSTKITQPQCILDIHVQTSGGEQIHELGDMTLDRSIAIKQEEELDIESDDSTTDVELSSDDAHKSTFSPDCAPCYDLWCAYGGGRLDDEERKEDRYVCDKCNDIWVVCLQCFDNAYFPHMKNMNRYMYDELIDR